MITITKLSRRTLSSLRNDEFFQFFTRVRSMIIAVTVAKLNIEKVYADFSAVYAKLDEALKKIVKSALTKKIAEADAARDAVFRGLTSARKTAEKHFNKDIREAGERLLPVFETYGDLANRPSNEATSAIYNLCHDLQTSYAEECITTGIVPWINELDKANKAMEALMMERFEEANSRTDLVVREVRSEMIEVWYQLTHRIDSLQEVSGEDEGAPWAEFIGELNKIITYTDLLVAQRRGRAAAKKEDEETDN